MKRRVKVGSELEAEVRLVDGRARRAITYTTLGVGGAMLVGAVCHGVIHGEYSMLQNLWSIIGPIFGGIVVYYFHPPRID